MIQIGSFTIQYNRATRAWTAQNGRFSKSFQTGSVGKQQAIRYAIREAYPAVAQAVAHLCQQNANATGRAWAAATLLVTSHVLTPTEADGPDCLARVLSQRPRIPPDWYRLTYTEMGFGCDCTDFAQGGVVVADQLLCKHLLAYRLARHLNWALAERIPGALAAEAHQRWQVARQDCHTGGDTPAPADHHRWYPSLSEWGTSCTCTGNCICRVRGRDWSAAV